MATRQLTSAAGLNGLKSCIADCLSCEAICLQTVTRCLELGGTYASAQQVGVLLDCARAASAAADFMLRQSSLHPRTCGVCADACERCADACERFDDPFMRRCAEICRRCADSCYDLSQMSAAA
jgi:hypothetical protein